MANKKTETVQEFLARGGKITQLAPKQEEVKGPVIRKLNGSGGVINLMTLAEAELFYGESRAKIKQPKAPKVSKIDISALPAHIREKYINKLLKEQENNDGNEEDEEE